jgi:hypothetical protein
MPPCSGVAGGPLAAQAGGAEGFSRRSPWGQPRSLFLPSAPRLLGRTRFCSRCPGHNPPCPHPRLPLLLYILSSNRKRRIGRSRQVDGWAWPAPESLPATSPAPSRTCPSSNAVPAPSPQHPPPRHVALEERQLRRIRDCRGNAYHAGSWLGQRGKWACISVPRSHSEHAFI